MPIYNLMRILYEKFSEPNKNLVVPCPERFCFSVDSFDEVIKSKNLIQCSPIRFYQFYGADSLRRHTKIRNNREHKEKIHYIIRKEKSRRWRKRHHNWS